MAQDLQIIELFGDNVWSDFEKFKSQFSDATDALLEFDKVAKNLQVKIANGSSLQDLNDSTKEYAATLQDLAATQANYKKSSDDMAAAQVRANNEKAQSDREYVNMWKSLLKEKETAEKQAAKAADDAMKKKAKEMEDETRRLKDIQNDYKQLSLAYTDAANKAKQYGAIFGTNNEQFKSLAKTASDLGGKLKEIDAAVGQNQRNVGNYSNAILQSFEKIWSGIRMAAYIIPGLGIGGIIDLMVTGVSKAAEWAASLVTAAKAIDTLKMSRDDLNKAFQSPELLQAVQQVDTLKMHVDLAKQGFIDKKEVVNEYNQTLGKTMGTAKSLDDVEQALTKHADAYVKMTLYKAAANLALEESAKKTLEAENNRQKALDEYKTAADRVTNAVGHMGEIEANEATKQLLRAGTEKQLAEDRKKRQDKAVKDAQDAANAQENIAKNFMQKAAEIAKGNNFDMLGGAFDDKATKARHQAEHNYKIELPFSLGNFDTALSQKQIDKAFEDMAKYIKSKGQHSDALSQSELNKSSNEMTKFFSGKGLFTTQQQYLDAIKKNWQEVRDAAMSALNDIAGMIQQVMDSKYDAQIKKIQDQIDGVDALAQAEKDANAMRGLSYDDLQKANAQTDAKYAAKKSDLEAQEKARQRQKAAFDKEMAIGQIIMTTAEGVAGALAMKPWSTANIALAAIVGAMGAAQVAVAASAPLPQYKDGTLDHIGGAAILGDGYEKELVIEPSGKAYLSSDRPSIYNLPAHTKVLPPAMLMQMASYGMLSPEVMGSLQRQRSDSDLTQMVNRLDKGFKELKEAYNNRPINSTMLTEKGFHAEQQRGNQRTVYLNKNLA